jgi:hypothetical protein
MLRVTRWCKNPVPSVHSADALQRIKKVRVEEGSDPYPLSTLRTGARYPLYGNRSALVFPATVFTARFPDLPRAAKKLVGNRFVTNNAKERRNVSGNVGSGIFRALFTVTSSVTKNFVSRMVRPTEVNGNDVIQFRRVVVGTQQVYRFVTVPAYPAVAFVYLSKPMLQWNPP